MLGRRNGEWAVMGSASQGPVRAVAPDVQPLPAVQGGVGGWCPWRAGDVPALGDRRRVSRDERPGLLDARLLLFPTLFSSFYLRLAPSEVRGAWRVSGLRNTPSTERQRVDIRSCQTEDLEILLNRHRDLGDGFSAWLGGPAVEEMGYGALDSGFPNTVQLPPGKRCCQGPLQLFLDDRTVLGYCVTVPW